MARNTQTIPIDLQSGIITNASLYEIGARLWKATNTVWDYRYPVLEEAFTGPWGHRQPQIFPVTATIPPFTGCKSMRDLMFHHNTVLNAAPFVFAMGANASNQLSYWRAENGGAEMKFASGVVRSTLTADLAALGCSAYWANPGKDPNGGADIDVGVMIFSHSEATHIYYLLDDKNPQLDTTVHGARSLTVDSPGAPPGCAAMAIHLNRLWMLTDATSGTSKLYFTDPFNLDSVRSTNVTQVEGRGVALLPGQFGTIDNSLMPRLLVFTQTSVGVLDGDPQLGGGLQADYRVLRVGLGARSPHAACMTPFGAFFLGTDGGLWRVPPGATGVEPVGESVRNTLAWNPILQTVDLGATAGGSIVWYDPYLYIFPGGETSYTIIAEPSAEGVKFWGPVSTQYGQRACVVRAPVSDFQIHANGVQQISVHAIDSVSVDEDPTVFNYAAFMPNSGRAAGAGTGYGRVSSCQTGLINVPGHAVQLMRVILETMQLPETTLPATPTHTVTATNERGTTVTGYRLPEPVAAAGAYSQAVTNVAHYGFPPMDATRGVSVKIQQITEANLGLVRALAEVHVTAAQF